MPLVTMKEILRDARVKSYAVGCYNAINLEMVRGVIQAAEEERAPVILCHAEMHFKYTPLEMIGPIMINEARRAKVPVGVHLDHGKSFSSLIKAMHLGFTSVMYDGSMLLFEENAANTREIVKIARELGVSVEAELGHVARPEGGGAEDEGDATAESDSLHTKPEEASRFVEETGVDALAVAFGTAHGVYLTEPKLDFIRLKALKEAIGIPLVMHGGSGLSVSDFQRSIELGINKINYYTNMALAVSKTLKEKLNAAEKNVYYHDVAMWSIDAIREDIAATIRIFGGSGRA